MKLVTAVIRPERVQQVKEALFQAGISGITLSRVSGHGGEQEIVEHYRGTRVMVEFRDKVEVRMAVSEPFVQAAIDAVCRGARTGEVGDGKIFVQPLERVVRIRTGEQDAAALTPVTETRLTPA
ncbi:transcriptional regulator [Deinococcus indicus]|uniref:Transcriptional regulator n=1 Tax=Deinococcus indicus TaxID=223556 RepID=A0A246BEW8_9DEIO|nr:MULTISPECIES: P-II family nitrogen regulator [Deinococcus]MBX8464704.1 P-II family nitrogen regulator [Deinococcus sp. RIT780]MCD0156933.1 P-II family nitrogen regulator [Deinococcus sp. 6GRE01]MCD0160743.1 P-II family nitrogen regulator [Deinococcus sp. 6YEL10]MCD0164976.1 P-II family nitrogen regulator [Deinococcus sp. 12RED42]MCD0168664.1 P-II family nitrogen regulator [Deinococcus sp. 23YEL01]